MSCKPNTARRSRFGFTSHHEPKPENRIGRGVGCGLLAALYFVLGKRALVLNQKPRWIKPGLY